jgi:hypothetical protein
MKIRLLVTLAGMAISLAVPASAQEKEEANGDRRRGVRELMSGSIAMT